MSISCYDVSCLIADMHAGPSASEDASEVLTGKRKRKTIDYKVLLLAYICTCLMLVHSLFMKVNVWW